MRPNSILNMAPQSFNITVAHMAAQGKSITAFSPEEGITASLGCVGGSCLSLDLFSVYDNMRHIKGDQEASRRPGRLGVLLLGSGFCWKRGSSVGSAEVRPGYQDFV